MEKKNDHKEELEKKKINNGSNIYNFNNDEERNLLIMKNKMEQNNCVNYINNKRNLDTENNTILLNDIILSNDINNIEGIVNYDKENINHLNNNINKYHENFLSNVRKHYKKKSINYMNKKYFDDLNNIYFLLEDFTNTYKTCSNNLKCILQLLKYELDKEKKASVYFSNNQKFLYFAVPLMSQDKSCDYNINDEEKNKEIKKNEKIGEEAPNNSMLNGKEYILEGTTYNILGSYKKSHAVNNIKNDTKEYIETKNDNIQSAINNSNDNLDSISNKNSKLNVKKIYRNMNKWVKKNKKYPFSNKKINFKYFIMNDKKKDKSCKCCIKKKIINDEKILLRMNIFTIRHKNHFYKLKFNNNFVIKRNKVFNKKNGKLYKFYPFYNELLLKYENDPNGKVETNEKLKCLDKTISNNTNDQEDHNTNDKNHINNMNNHINNKIDDVAHTNINTNDNHNMNNNVNVSNNNNILDDLFISDDDINLIYMYNTNTNIEKQYSLEKININ